MSFTRQILFETQDGNIQNLRPGGINYSTDQKTFTVSGGTAGGFSNPGVNIVETNNVFSNALVLGTNYASGVVPSNLVGWVNSNSSYMTDGNTTNSNGLANETNAPLASFDIDLGAGNEQAINAIGYDYYFDNGNRIPNQLEIKQSADGIAYSSLDIIPISHTNAAGKYDFEFTNSTPYRYYRFIWSIPASAFLLNEFYMYVAGKASTLNTVDAALVFSGSKSFAPATLALLDGNDNPITTDINVDYNKNGAGFTGTLLDLDSFKALSVALFDGSTSLVLQLQPVGDRTLKQVQLSTQSARTELQTNGLKVIINGKEVAMIDGNGDILGNSLKALGSSLSFEASGDDVTGNFQNAGANIQFASGAWANLQIDGPNLALSQPVLEPIAGSAGNIPANIVDGNVATESSNVDSINGFVIDLGSDLNFNLVKFRNSSASNRNINGIVVSVSADNVSFVNAQNFSISQNTLNSFVYNSGGAFRYVKVTMTGDALCHVDEFQVFNTGPASTNNTLDTNLGTISSTSIAPASFEAYDDANQLIQGSNKISVAFAFNGGAFGALVDQDSISSTYSIQNSITQVEMQLQAIGNQKFSRVLVKSVSGEVLIGGDGSIQLKVGGVDVFNVNENGANNDKFLKLKHQTNDPTNESGHSHLWANDENYLLFQDEAGTKFYIQLSGQYRSQELDQNTTLTLLSPYFNEVDCSGGQVDITLPLGVNGKAFAFAKKDNSVNSLRTLPSGSDTIIGGTFFTATTQYDTFELVFRDGVWYVL